MQDLYLCTPLRPAGQSPASTRIDTEGRRSRFHSPPPPPGASPSLLLPTPSRYGGISTDTSYLDKENSGDMTIDPIDTIRSSVSPLKAPVFQINEASESTKSKVIRLHQWYPKFRSNGKVRLPSSEITNNLTHWIVFVGVLIKDESIGVQRGSKEPWRSSLVHKRNSASSFETASKGIYELVGPGDFDQTSMRTCSEFASKFQEGLPEDWIDLVAKEARRLGHVRYGDEDGSISVDSPPLPEMRKKRGSLKRKMTSTARPEFISLSRETSEVSPSPSLTNAYTEPTRKKSRTSQNKVDVAFSKTPKGISREVLQLQRSKLGNLALVEAAILEGINTQEKIALPRSKKSKSKVEKAMSETVLDGMEMIAKQSQTSKTPLRSSSRARVGMREWWKVSSEKGDVQRQKIINKAKQTKVQNISIEDSPGVALALPTDYSDVSNSDEEYKCASSSGEEEVEVRKVEVKVQPMKYTRKRRAREREKDETPSETLTEHADVGITSMDVESLVTVPFELGHGDVIEIEATSNDESTGIYALPIAGTEIVEMEPQEDALMHEVHEINTHNKDLLEATSKIGDSPMQLHMMDAEDEKKDNASLQTVDAISTSILNETLPDVSMIDDTNDEDDLEASTFYFSD